MSTYRLNLTIDAEFAKVLQFFKNNFPLLSDVEIIKMIVGEKYVEKRQNQQNQITKKTQKSEFQKWSDSLPVLELSTEEENELEKRLEIHQKSQKIRISAEKLLNYLNN